MSRCSVESLGLMVNSKKLKTGSRTISAGIPYTLLLRLEAGVSNFWASAIGLRDYTLDPKV